MNEVRFTPNKRTSPGAVVTREECQQATFEMKEAAN
jgi:hypothetical protein